MAELGGARFTTVPPAATVPLRTLVKNNSVMGPALTEVMSHGPLMAPPEKVSTTWPELLRTRRQPDPGATVLPSLVGRRPHHDPTSRKHPDRAASQVRPHLDKHPGGDWGQFGRTPGVAEGPALGSSWTIVVPRPQARRARPLLKLLTGISGHLCSLAPADHRHAIGIDIPVRWNGWTDLRDGRVRTDERSGRTESDGWSGHQGHCRRGNDGHQGAAERPTKGR